MNQDFFAVRTALSPRYSNIINCYHIFISSRIFGILRYWLGTTVPK